MKPRIVGIVLAAMMVLAVIVSPETVWAQTLQDNRTVNIPFNFHINSKAYPAGKYEISHGSEPHWYLLRSADFKVGQYLHANAVGTQCGFLRAGLVFRRYGSSYFLSQIWVGLRGGELPISNMEREVAAQWQKGSDNTIVLATRN